MAVEEEFVSPIGRRLTAVEIEGGFSLIGETESHRQIVEKIGGTMRVDLLL